MPGKILVDERIGDHVECSMHQEYRGIVYDCNVVHTQTDPITEDYIGEFDDLSINNVSHVGAGSIRIPHPKTGEWAGGQRESLLTFSFKKPVLCGSNADWGIATGGKGENFLLCFWDQEEMERMGLQ